MTDRRIRTEKTGPLAARFFILSFFMVLFTGPCISYAANDHLILDSPATPALQRVRTLIRADVLGLAERILEQQGPALLPNGEWLNWERQLWALYQSSGSWQKLYQRVQSIPPAFPLSVRTEAEAQSVNALIALGNGQVARRILRRQLLSTTLSERDKRGLRRQVIESYLADDHLYEANRSAVVFQQDFRPQDKNWLMLGSRIALQSGNPDTAVNLLAPLVEPDARLLRLWARSRNQSMTAQQVLASGERLLELDEFQPLRAPVLAIMADAAGVAGNRIQQADLIEQYLLDNSELSSGAINGPLFRTIPVSESSDLFAVYVEIAQEQANKAGLLAGEENSWSTFAREISDDDGLHRRAVWAYIASTTNNLSRQIAADNLVNAVVDSGRLDLVRVLFGENKPLGQLKLSPTTALRLSNLAIEAGKVELAAEANTSVSSPPPGMEYGDWLIYTGRIAIIAGRHRQGAAQLEKWIDSTEALTPEQTDKVLQPIFDLQTVEQHTLAIPLLEKINDKSPGGKYTREIAFWIAESYGATRQHIKAADFFLFSAMQKDNGFDQWGESARFRAAEALLEGNFFEDSLRLFDGLLARAQEEPQKQALQQKIQQIWLRRSSFGKSGLPTVEDDKPED